MTHGAIPAEQVVAIDLGGTVTKIGLTTATGELSRYTELPTEFTGGASRQENAEAFVPLDWLAEVVRGTAASAPGRVQGFGVAVPGVVAGGRVVAATNIGWFDLSLADELTQRTGLPGAVGHDVRCGGLAEWQVGCGAGVDQFVFLPLGTGIACAVVVDGRMLEAEGYAGEIGHVRVPAAGDLLCGCGQRGCLEMVSSAAGVRRSYARIAGTPIEDAPSTADVSELARRGDLDAVAAFDLAGEGLATAVQQIATLFGPRKLSIGGGLAGSLDLLRPALDRAVEALTFQRRPELVVAQLGPRAGLLGAGLLGWQR